jgi:hypothetical protein
LGARSEDDLPDADNTEAQTRTQIRAIFLYISGLDLVLVDDPHSKDKFTKILPIFPG